MSGQPTRAGLPPETSSAFLARLPAEWRAFLRFLRRPALPDRADLSLKGSARALGPLLALDLLLMAAVLGAIGVATALGLKLPDHMLNGVKLTPVLVAFMIVGAPIGEEIIFRGWLSGRLGHVLGSVLCAIAAGGLMAGVALTAAGHAAGSATSIAGFGALVLAAVLVFVLRKRDAGNWFQRHFAWFYYGSALAFAAMHLTNFAGAGPSPAQLPMVMPQFVLGLILGYLRVSRGLATGIALHMLHNSLFASLLLLGVK